MKNIGLFRSKLSVPGLGLEEGEWFGYRDELITPAFIGLHQIHLSDLSTSAMLFAHCLI